MKQYSAEEKAKWLEGWKGSGESMSAYAGANGISPQTFTKWAKKTTEQSGFVEIRVEPGTIIPAGRNEILIEKEELRIHLPLNARSPELRAVLEGL
jgi:transposase-like protein